MFFSFCSPGLRAAVLTTSLLLAGSFAVYAQAPTKQWDKTFGVGCMTSYMLCNLQVTAATS